MEKAGKKYHVKELLNIIIFGLISSKFVKSKKQTNEQKYQTNKQIEKNSIPKPRIEIKVIFKLIVMSSSNSRRTSSQ